MSDLFIYILAFPCSENFSYRACIAACEVADSCQNNEVASLDSDSCSVLTEGCVCAAGTILHRAHTAVCIPEEKCGMLDVIFFFIVCKLVVRCIISSKLSSGLMLCRFWTCHSVEDSRWSVNMNCTGELAGNVLVTPALSWRMLLKMAGLAYVYAF